jgi:hypothetical protein
MSLSVRGLRRAGVGAATVSDMALKLGLNPVPRPLSVRNLILTFGIPLQPTNLRISWPEGPFPQRLVDHSPNSTNVPEDGANLAWDDPGNRSQRAATSWSLRLQFEGTANDFAIAHSASFSMHFELDTFYS